MHATIRRKYVYIHVTIRIYTYKYIWNTYKYIGRADPKIRELGRLWRACMYSLCGACPAPPRTKAGLRLGRLLGACSGPLGRLEKSIPRLIRSIITFGPLLLFSLYSQLHFIALYIRIHIYIQTFIIEIWRYVHIYSYFSKRNLFHSIEIHSQITRRKNIYSRKALKTHFVVFGRRGQKRSRFQSKSVSLIHVIKTLGIFTLALERHVPKKIFWPRRAKFSAPHFPNSDFMFSYCKCNTFAQKQTCLKSPTTHQKLYFDAQ